MNQIMRLRRIAGSDYEIDDRNNGHRHENAFVENIRKNGLLHEADLLPDSYGGKFHPRAVPELLELAARDHQGAAARQGHAAEGAAAPAPQGVQGRCSADFDEDRGAATSASSSTSTSPATTRTEGADRPGVVGAQDGAAPGARQAAPDDPGSTHEGRLLARLRRAAGSRPSCTARWRTSRRCSTSSWSSSTAPRCCGAGVIAEHNQELADTLNARTFALAQQTDGAELMMNICSTCQGAQTECQERLDANAEYRAHDQRAPRRGGAALREAA